jgi:hypothetical protein
VPDTCALARSPHRPRAIDRADERQGFLRVLNPGLSLWLDEKRGSGHWLFSLERFRRAKGSLGFFKAFRLSKDPPSFTTLFEDSVALLGILIAAAAIVASAALGHPELDGAGSIAIGLILAATSIF